MSHKQRNKPGDQLPEKQVQNLSDNELMSMWHHGLYRFYIWQDLRGQATEDHQIAVLNRLVIELRNHMENLKEELTRRECDPDQSTELLRNVKIFNLN